MPCGEKSENMSKMFGDDFCTMMPYWRTSAGMEGDVYKRQLYGDGECRKADYYYRDTE